MKVRYLGMLFGVTSILSAFASGCTYDLGGIDRSAYILADKDHVVNYRAVTIGVFHLLAPGPDNLVTGLAAQDAVAKKTSPAAMLASIPRWRILDSADGGIYNVAEKLTLGAAPDVQRWIISVRPVVIGLARGPWDENYLKQHASRYVGDTATVDGDPGTLTMGANIRLAHSDDLETKMFALIVCRDDMDWPAGDGASRISLPAPVTIKELLATKPWLNGG
jgi:hypothetical protein